MPDQAYVRLVVKNPDGSSDEVVSDGLGKFRAVAFDPFSEAIDAGNGYLVGGTTQTTTGSQSCAIAIENTSQTKPLVIPAFLIQADASSPLSVQFLESATVAGGTQRTPMNLNRASGFAPEATVTIGVNILTGGSEFSPSLFVHENMPLKYKGPKLIIPPGGMVAARITGQSLTTINYKFNASFIQEQP